SLWQIFLLLVLGIFVLGVGAVLGAGICLVVAFLRNGLVWFVGALCGLLAAPLVGLSRIAARASAAVQAPIQRSLDGLGYRSQHHDEDVAPSTWAGWNIIGPLVYFTLFLLLGAGDFYLTLQRIAALFGLPSLDIGGQQLDILIGVLW